MLFCLLDLAVRSGLGFYLMLVMCSIFFHICLSYPITVIISLLLALGCILDCLYAFNFGFYKFQVVGVD